jgi:DNA-binding response OmpR family regulator
MIVGDEILVAEDDEAIRGVVAQHLELEGYRVYSTRDGQDAHNFIKRMNRKFLALVVDLDMPFKSGEELIHELELESERFSAYVLISGHPSDHPTIKHLRNLRSRTPLYYLPKPFEASELSKLLDSVRSMSSQGGGK